ncbi:DUF2625 family protein [bacterium]|nr:DUF2625 family protein [bacterium]
MTPSLVRLIEDSIGPMGLPIERADAESMLQRWGRCGRELAALLAERNGLYAFDSALLVRPLGKTDSLHELFDWNKQKAWSEYGDLSDLLFFAEDIFGHPFAIEGERIVSFDLETGEREEFAESLEAFAATIFDEPALHTGWPLAHEWQEAHNALPIGARLAPKQPFVLGGDYVLDHLVPVNEIAGLTARANLARQLKDLPPGSAVTYELQPL